MSVWGTTEIDERLANILADNQGQASAILDNIGIKVDLDWLPEYVELRDELAMMSRFRRWLSWRKREKLYFLRIRQQQMHIAQVLDAATLQVLEGAR